MRTATAKRKALGLRSYFLINFYFGLTNNFHVFFEAKTQGEIGAQRKLENQNQIMFLSYFGNTTLFVKIAIFKLS